MREKQGVKVASLFLEKKCCLGLKFKKNGSLFLVWPVLVIKTNIEQLTKDWEKKPY